MFGTVATKKGLKHAGIRPAVLAFAFLCAQLIISFHHVGDAHGWHASNEQHNLHSLHGSDDADKEFSLDCEVCTVSAGIFDTPLTTEAIQRFRRSQTPAIAGIEINLPPAGGRLHPPRAPPQYS